MPKKIEHKFNPNDFQIMPTPTMGGVVNIPKKVISWEGVSRSMVEALNIFKYNGIYISKDENGEVVTLDENPKEIIRNKATSMIDELSPTLAKQIADATVDRIKSIRPRLDPDVIYFANGDYNVSKGKFTPIIKPEFNHRRIAWDYKDEDVLKADYPKGIEIVKDFLEQISDGDSEIATQVTQMFGASLLPTGQFRKAFFMLGDGGNGKSSILNILAKVHGEGKLSRIPLESMTGQRAPFMRLSLVNKTVNIEDDLSQISMKQTGEFKSLVAGEGMNAEVKGGKIFNFYNEATYIAGGNSIPNINDKGSSTAIMDRMVIIPLNHKFSKTPAGKKKAMRLLHDDVVTLMANTAARAATNAMAKGLLMGKSTTKANRQFEMENDTVMYWLDNTELFKTIGNEHTNDFLFTDYCKFVSKAGMYSVGVHNFGKSLNKHLENDIKKVRMTLADGSRKWGYKVINTKYASNHAADPKNSNAK